MFLHSDDDIEDLDESDDSIHSLGEFRTHLAKKTPSLSPSVRSQSVSSLKSGRNSLGTKRSPFSKRISTRSHKKEATQSSLHRKSVGHSVKRSRVTASLDLPTLRVKEMRQRRSRFSSVRNSSQGSSLENEPVNLQEHPKITPNGAVTPYKMTVTTADVLKSQHYRLRKQETSKKELINPELDIKNKMLEDKRKAML